MTDPEKLGLLASWFDARQRIEPRWRGREVQEDIVTISKRYKAMLSIVSLAHQVIWHNKRGTFKPGVLFEMGRAIENFYNAIEMESQRETDNGERKAMNQIEQTELPDVSKIPYLGEAEYWVWHDRWEDGQHLCGYRNLELLVEHYCERTELPAGEYTIHSIDSSGKHATAKAVGKTATFFSMLTPFAQ